MIRGVLGWSNRQKEAMSARAKQVGLSPTQAHSDSEQKLRKLEGGTRPGRPERLPENFFVLLSCPRRYSVRTSGRVFHSRRPCDGADSLFLRAGIFFR
jgi:hypothetical protein